MIFEDAIYRVFFSDDQAKHFLGTAFAIAPNWFLTCAHLFDNITNKNKIFLRGPGKHGDIGRINWKRHPEIDCCAGILASGGGGVDTYINFQLSDLTSEIGELKCMGFFDAESGLQKWIDRLSGVNHINGWVALQNTLADGISGGPVLLGDRVVAIVRADNQRTNQKYILPLITVFSWLESEGFRGVPSDPKQMTLASVPIRPPVRAADITDVIIRAFAKQLPDQTKAAAFVERAMDSRKGANPEGFTAEQILLHRAEFTFTGSVPGTLYWENILLLAAEKSRRTVAALFFEKGAPEPAMMADYEGAAYIEFRNWLIQPNASSL